MGKSILPAEGMTLEFMLKPFRTILLQPLLVGAVLLISLQDPSRFHRLVAVGSKNRITARQADRALKLLFALGLVYRLNRILTKLVLNNFCSDRTWNWKQEVVLVTGGSSGIGRTIVDKLSEHGVKVVVFDLAELKHPFPSSVRFYNVDITSSAKISEAAEQVRESVGHPTVLVNNAGVGFNAEILAQSEKQIRLTFEVNILAHFWLVQEFVPYMIKRNHGHIVTVASLASFMVHAGNVDYASTKAAALAFHEGLASELRSRYGANKVRTTVIHPTWVRTPLIESLSRRKDFGEFVLEPSTVADAVVAQIFKTESAQLILPGRYSFVPGIRMLPGWMQELMRSSVAKLLQNPST